VELNLTDEQKKFLENKQEPKVETPSKPKTKKIRTKEQKKMQEQEDKKKKQQERRAFQKEKEKSQFNSPVDTITLNESVIDPKKLTNKEIAEEKELIISFKKQLLQQAHIVLVTCDQLDLLYGKPLSFIVQSFSSMTKQK